MDKNLPLVSVVVITYNSSKFVIETLDSVYNQDYRNIELIISDDCSTDDTLDICKKWCDDHNKRFTDIRVVKTPRNGGICKNYNHALSHVSGEWTKFIAGDDILYPHCISTLVKAAADGHHEIFFGALTPFSIIDGKTVEKETRAVGKYCYDTDLPHEQLERMLERVHYVAEGPTLFVKTATLKALGGMDECYPMLEDYPTAMKFAYNNKPVGFVDTPLVRYREYDASVAHSNTKFHSMIHLATRDYRIKLAKDNRRYAECWHNYLLNQIEKGIMRNKPVAKYFYKALLPTDIYALKSAFKKR